MVSIFHTQRLKSISLFLKKRFILIVKFKNWEKYNGRSDIKTFTWFRVSNTILQDPKIYSLEIEEFYAMFYLLCEASKSGKKGEVYINHDHARISSRVQDRVLDRTINKLKQLQLVEVRTLRGTFTSAHATDRQTYKQTDKISATGSVTPPPLDRIWNENCNTLSKVRSFGSSRLRLMKSRWKENPSEEYWTCVVKKISASKFCCGENERNWKADFDFLLKPDTHHKVLEGKYDNKTKKKHQTHAEYLAEIELLKKQSSSQ